MTIEEYVKGKMVNTFGLWPEDTVPVMEAVKQQAGDSMSGRWSDDIEGYPTGLLTHFILTAKDEARKWGRANKPQAFWLVLLES